MCKINRMLLAGRVRNSNYVILVLGEEATCGARNFRLFEQPAT